MTTTIKAIPVNDNDARTTFNVMVAHAGRNDRTGSKVHMAQLTLWKSTGRCTVESCNCSNNGRLRGNLITAAGYDFSKVSCKNCNATPEAAERRNGVAVDLTIELSRDGIRIV